MTKKEKFRVENSSYLAKDEGGISCYCFLSVVLLGIVILSFVDEWFPDIPLPFSILIYVLVFLITGTLLIINAMSSNSFICSNCGQKKYALFLDHRCRMVDPLKYEYEKKLIKELKEIKSSSLFTYFQNEREKKIFENNMKLLLEFEKTENFKYCMIAMGSILEFLLKRLFENIGVSVKKDDFYNHVEIAIQKNLFGKKKHWELVQSHLRDFRNYVHIYKEIDSEDIDKNWYNIIKPVFNVLYSEFKLDDLEESPFKENTI
jgi:hypothetical protein